MKTEIEIKSVFGKVLFSFEKEDNSIKETMIKAIRVGANLVGANLGDANLHGLKIKKCAVFSGLYKYIVIAFISEDNEKYVKMGCFMRKVSEWESNFWNNNFEFPNDGSEKSNLRLFAFETAKKWFNIITP
jgi:hypothetical protein